MICKVKACEIKAQLTSGLVLNEEIEGSIQCDLLYSHARVDDSRWGNHRKINK